MSQNTFQSHRSEVVNNLKSKMNQVYNALLTTDNPAVTVVKHLLPTSLESLDYDVVVFRTLDELQNVINNMQTEIESRFSSNYNSTIGANNYVPFNITYDTVVPILNALIGDYKAFKEFSNKGGVFTLIKELNEYNRYLMSYGRLFENDVLPRMNILTKIETYFSKPEFVDILPEGFNLQTNYNDSSISYRLTPNEFNTIRNSHIDSIINDNTGTLMHTLLINGAFDIHAFITSNSDMSATINTVNNFKNNIDNTVNTKVTDVRTGTTLELMRNAVKTEILSRVNTKFESVLQHLRTNVVKIGVQPMVALNVVTPLNRMNMNDYSLENGVLKINRVANFRTDWIMFPEGVFSIEFTSMRNGFWLIYDRIKNNGNTISAMAFQSQTNRWMTGKVVDFTHTAGSTGNGSFSTAVIEATLNHNNNFTADKLVRDVTKIENPFNPELFWNTKFKIVRNTDGTELKVFVKRENDAEMHLYMHYRISDYGSRFGDRRFRMFGFWIGVSVSENIPNSDNMTIMKDIVLGYNDIFNTL